MFTGVALAAALVFAEPASPLRPQILTSAEVAACVQLKSCEVIDDQRAVLSDTVLRRDHVIGVLRKAADGTVDIYDYRPLHGHYDLFAPLRESSVVNPAERTQQIDAFRDLQVAWLHEVDEPSTRKADSKFPSGTAHHDGPSWSNRLSGADAHACVAGGYCETIPWPGTSTGDETIGTEPVVAVTLREKTAVVTYRWDRESRGYVIAWVTPPFANGADRDANGIRVLHDFYGAKPPRPLTPTLIPASSSFIPARKSGEVTVVPPLNWTDKDQPMTVNAIGNLLIEAGDIRSVMFLPNDTLLAAVTPKTVMLWTTPRSIPKASFWTPASPLVLNTDGDEISTWSANGRRVAIQTAGHVRVHQVAIQTGTPPPPIEVVYPDVPNAIGLSGGGNLLFVSSGGRLVLYNLRDPEPLADFVTRTDVMRAMAVSDDAKYVALGGQREIVVIRLLDHGVEARLPLNAAVTSLAFSPDNAWLLTATADHAMSIWDTQTYDKVRAAITDYTVQYWSDRHWRQSASATHNETIRSVAFAPGGRIVAVGDDAGNLAFFVVETLAAIPLSAPLKHPHPVTSIAFSRDGRVIASASGDSIALWDTPHELTAGPTPRPVTAEDLRAEHAHVVEVHAQFKQKRDEVSTLRASYEQQANGYKLHIRALFTQHNLSTWKEGERVPEIRNLVQATQKTLAYVAELQAIESRFNVALLDMENVARNLVLDMRMMDVVPADQFRSMATKVADLQVALPDYKNLVVRPSQFPSEAATWSFIFAGATPPSALH